MPDDHFDNTRVDVAVTQEVNKFLKENPHSVISKDLTRFERHLADKLQLKRKTTTLNDGVSATRKSVPALPRPEKSNKRGADGNKKIPLLLPSSS